ncbi:hypothetical protein CR513_62767, partial [Mucuna pruriens]
MASLGSTMQRGVASIINSVNLGTVSASPQRSKSSKRVREGQSSLSAATENAVLPSLSLTYFTFEHSNKHSTAFTLERRPPLRIREIRVSSHRHAELDNPHVPLPRCHVNRSPPLGIHRIHLQFFAVTLQQKLHHVDSVHRRGLVQNWIVDFDSAAGSFQKLHHVEVPGPNCEWHEGFCGCVGAGVEQISDGVGAGAFDGGFQQSGELRFRACGYGFGEEVAGLGGLRDEEVGDVGANEGDG